MTPEESIRAYLEEQGHAYDTAIPEDLFEEHRDTLHRSQLSLPKDGPTYRDDRRMHSVHVIDLRDMGGGIVGHLEWFNPEHHPILHALVDYPLWYAVFYWNTARRSSSSIIQVWKNRIREWNIV